MSSRPLKLAYVGFALLGAAVLGAFIYDRASRPPPRPAAAAAAAAGARAPDSPPTVPVQRPQVSLKDLDGKLRTLAEWDGKALVINFWATWCAPCRREIPLLNTVARDYAAKGVQVVGIAVDFADDVRAYTKEFPVRYPLLIGEEEGLAAARSFGVTTMALPFTAFTDKGGRVIAIRLGELHPAQLAAILAVIARVDAGELTPERARTEVEAALEALPSPAPAPHSPVDG